ncbi:AraC family transcriptional regulator [Pseudonocardia humida]|uniref:AraC family transcriptional regulator n=1 Tax=Pseudonocardia humida TaxID=2800819 RepID=A0ABT1A099_9PSEU|nr:AraC family transcriptional regulator [Pseudonocardia humida]MCO1656431.1 AraC family transcriptional regulator [Pseudonocardia humida]
MTTAQLPDESDYRVGAPLGFTSTDPDEVEVRTEALLQCDHRMTLLGGGPDFAARIGYRSVDGFSVMASTYARPVEIVCLPPIPWVTLSVISGGRALFTGAHGEDTVVAADRAAVLAYDCGVRMRWEPRVSQFMIAVSKSRIERFLQRLLQEPLREPLRFDTAVDLGGDGRGIAGSVSAIRRVLARYGPAGPPPVLIAELEHSLLSALLFGQRHNYSDAMLSPSPPPSARVVARVLELLESAWDAPLSIADLAEFAGVSQRSLHAAFHRQLGVSPMAYVRRRRLQRAREELLSAAPTGTTTVTYVALRNGFAHGGRFAAAYRRTFGESPSDTLRRGAATGAG